jgi:DNA-binding protein YbaB
MQPSPRTNAQLRARMEELLGEYEQLKRNMSAAHRRTRAMSGSASTTDTTVTVRVDSQGRPTGLEIDPKAYRRYSPSQLASEILRLHREASRDVASRVGEVMAPFLPEGVSYERLSAGDVDPSEWAVPQPLTDETFDAWRARFSGRPSAEPPPEESLR